MSARAVIFSSFFWLFGWKPKRLYLILIFKRGLRLFPLFYSPHYSAAFIFIKNGFWLCLFCSNLWINKEITKKKTQKMYLITNKNKIVNLFCIPFFKFLFRVLLLLFRLWRCLASSVFVLNVSFLCIWLEVVQYKRGRKQVSFIQDLSLKQRKPHWKQQQQIIAK